MSQQKFDRNNESFQPNWVYLSHPSSGSRGLLAISVGIDDKVDAAIGLRLSAAIVRSRRREAFGEERAGEERAPVLNAINVRGRKHEDREKPCTLPLTSW
jgi:hypothetical protein